MVTFLSQFLQPRLGSVVQHFYCIMLPTKGNSRVVTTTRTSLKEKLFLQRQWSILKDLKNLILGSSTIESLRGTLNGSFFIFAHWPKVPGLWGVPDCWVIAEFQFFFLCLLKTLIKFVHICVKFLIKSIKEIEEICKSQSHKTAFIVVVTL